jgi:hypothetical protein
VYLLKCIYIYIYAEAYPQLEESEDEVAEGLRVEGVQLLVPYLSIYLSIEYMYVCVYIIYIYNIPTRSLKSPKMKLLRACGLKACSSSSPIYLSIYLSIEYMYVCIYIINIEPTRSLKSPKMKLLRACGLKACSSSSACQPPHHRPSISDETQKIDDTRRHACEETQNRQLSLFLKKPPYLSTHCLPASLLYP